MRIGIVLTVIIGVVAIGLSAVKMTRATPGPYKMPEADQHHMMEMYYQIQLIDKNYHELRDPIAKAQDELLTKHCAAAGFKYGVDCDPHGDGMVIKKAAAEQGQTK